MYQFFLLVPLNTFYCFYQKLHQLLKASLYNKNAVDILPVMKIFQVFLKKCATKTKV